MFRASGNRLLRLRRGGRVRAGSRTFPLFSHTPNRGGSPATRMGLMPVTAAGHASWALGAKSMLDDVQDLAATKFRMSDMASLASRPTFQKDLALHVSEVAGGAAADPGRLRHRRGGRRRR